MRFILSLLVLFSCGLKENTTVESNVSKRPNVVFILTDDQVYRSIYSLNNKEVSTPNLDRLARSSKVMTNVFNQGGYSPAICVASRAMINTGQPLWKASRAMLADKTPLWGETFRKNNYKTFFVGKWHIKSKNKFLGLQRSFEWWGTKDGSIISSSNAKAKRRFFKAGGMLGSKVNNDYRRGWSADDVKLGGHWRKVGDQVHHSSELITNSAINFIDEQANSKQPFFMYVSYFAPHDPRQSPKKFLDKYDAKELSIPPNFLTMYPFDIGAHDIRAEKFALYPREKKELQIHRRDYYAIISHVDEQIGKLLDKIESLPEYENTYIIFTSDHGLSIGEHGLYAKQSLFDHAQKVPFFIKGPNIKSNKIDNTPLNLYQLFSTTASLCRIKLPKSVPNRSFASLLTGEKANYTAQHIYGAYQNHSRSVMNAHHKLILYPLIKKLFLFDRKKDKWEINNIAQDNKQIVKELYDQLKKLQKECGDSLVLPSFKKIILWHKPKHDAELELPDKLIKNLIK